MLNMIGPFYIPNPRPYATKNPLRRPWSGPAQMTRDSLYVHMLHKQPDQRMRVCKTAIVYDGPPNNQRVTGDDPDHAYTGQSSSTTPTCALFILQSIAKFRPRLIDFLRSEWDCPPVRSQNGSRRLHPTQGGKLQGEGERGSALLL